MPRLEWGYIFIRDGPLENLWGGGGVGRRSTKKIFVEGKIKTKSTVRTPINPKKYSCYGLTKNSYKEFDDDKKFLRLENPLPPPPLPHNFSNGPSLRISRMGSHIFGILGLRIFFISRNLKDNE